MRSGLACKEALKTMTLAACVLMPAATFAAQTPSDTAGAYASNCAACHGADRLGGTGPALLPENLRRLRKAKAVDAISYGLPASQMLVMRSTADFFLLLGDL